MARYRIRHRLGNRRNGRFVKHAVDAAAQFHNALVLIDVDVVELDLAQQPVEILALSGFEIIDRAYAFAALEQRADQGRPDEAGCAGDEIGGHTCWESYRPCAARARGNYPRPVGPVGPSTGPTLGLETAQRPRAGLAHELQAVMHTVRPPLPKFETLRNDRTAAPRMRTRNVFAFEALFVIAHALIRATPGFRPVRFAPTPTRQVDVRAAGSRSTRPIVSEC